MPPVSMTSVWLAARIASGVANLMVFAIQVPDTMPGWTSWSSRISAASRISSGIVGCSRRRRRQSRAGRAAIAAPAVTPAAAAG